MNKFNRIYFSEGNPWPEGHEIESCHLEGRICSSQRLEILLYLKTLDYRMNDDGHFLENVAEDSWGSKIVWNSYHSCRMNGTLLSGSPESPIHIASIPNSHYVIDPFPESHQKFIDDRLDFDIYLLGHDCVADHRIHIGPLLPGSQGYPITWSGKICLAYAGEQEFDYHFTLTTTALPITSISFPSEWDDAEAIHALRDLLIEAGEFSPGEDQEYKAMIRTGRDSGETK